MVMKKTGVLTCVLLGLTLSGCVGGTALQSHTQQVGEMTEDEYMVTKRPVDRHYIGAAWSKQFGPVEDPTQPEVRVKKERSFSGIQQDFAFKAGVAVGAQPVAAPIAGEASLQGGKVDKGRMEGLEIITPVNIADIPFEPDFNYITEALRLANFRMKTEKSVSAGVGVSAGSVAGTGTAAVEVGAQSRKGTEGEGLVVAYRLQTIDKASYTKKDGGMVGLSLDKTVDFPAANAIVKARLQVIEPGAGKSLPRNVLWACPKADALSRDMVAAWLVDVKPLDPKRKSLTIAFPAFPKIDECQSYGGVIFSKIDPLTDRIIRQKVNLMVVDADVTETMRPKGFDARVSVVEESFKIKTVKPGDL